MEDVTRLILSDIDTGSDFKSARLVSHLWLRITKKLFPDGHIKFANQLQTIVEKVLEYNRNIKSSHDFPMNLFNGYKRIHIDMSELSKNPNITWEFIKKHPELDWDMDGFVQNKNMVDELVDPFLATYTGAGDCITFTSKNLSWESIIKLGLDIYGFDNFPVLTMADLHRLGDLANKIPGFIMAMCADEEVLLTRDNLAMHDVVEENKYLSCEFVVQHCGFYPRKRAIENNFVHLYKKKLVAYRQVGKKIHVCAYSALKIYMHKFDLYDLPCDVHQFTGNPCSKCASPEEIKKMIADKTIIWDDYLFNKNFSVKYCSAYATRETLSVNYGSFELVMKLFPKSDYSENLNIPIRYVINNCHRRGRVCSRSDLTWDLIVKDMTANWIIWNQIWSNKFGCD